jgi:hypothetical protein
MVSDEKRTLSISVTVRLTECLKILFSVNSSKYKPLMSNSPKEILNLSEIYFLFNLIK